MTVVTRFAPSPTGMLHIGGARTALFSYLYARHHGGQFKLRIEDTDAARNSTEAYQAILDGLKWLGVSYDGDVIYQSQRAARHKEIAEELVKRGAAYYCYTTAEELAEQRKAAEARGEQFHYNRQWRDSTATPPASIKPSIRIKAPTSGAVVVNDAVLGDVKFEADSLDDFVILRSDGTPTYMLAVVVDDHDMGVTHIIRGDDHLTNAGRQLVIYNGMGWAVPQFAHIPLIHGPEGKKLSKRHGAASVSEYAAMGYLPEAMRNYLIRLGWSHGDDEIFSDAQAMEWFNLEAIGQAPARLDFAKLNHVNAHYIKLKPDAELASLVAPLLEVEVTPLLVAAMEGLKTRASTIVELANAAKFYFTRIPPDDKAKAALTTGREILAALVPVLEKLPEPWTKESIEIVAKEVAAHTGKKLGEVMGPIRAAITGSTASPSMFEVLAIMGKQESLARLRDACA